MMPLNLCCRRVANELPIYAFSCIRLVGTCELVDGACMHHRNVGLLILLLHRNEPQQCVAAVHAAAF